MISGYRWSGIALSVLAAAMATQATAADVDHVSSQQDADAEQTQLVRGNEIIVTARKKAESDLEVPIAIAAIGKEQLDRYNISTLGDVAAITPSLNVSTNFGSQGGNIALRGVSTAPLNASSEQAVAINLDGVTLSHGMAVRFAQFDIERIEVLKGPQSLYFGKNTTAGIISIVTADPTDSLYAMARVGYEFKADELVTEGVVSGPIAGDKLTARLALYRSDMQGYLRNPLAGNTVVPPPGLVALYGPLIPSKYKRVPEANTFGLRGTLKFTPSDIVTLRVKGTYVQRDAVASNQASQYFFCPSGVPAPGNPGNVPGIGNCTDKNDAVPLGQNPTAQQAGRPEFRDGQPYSEERQYLVAGNLDVKLSDQLTLSSVTSYYKMKLTDAANATFSPYPGIGVVNIVEKSDFTQELRLTSDFDGPLNFMAGVYYGTGTFFQDIAVSIPIVFGNSTVAPSPIYHIPNRTIAGFGNVTYALFDGKLKLSAGGRYTSERKRLGIFSQIAHAKVTDLGVSKVTFNKFNPELNVTFNPTRQTTIYATYKKGSKSGGFNAEPLTFAYTGLDASYDDESVSGVEGGIKTLALDGALRLDLAAYRYLYRGLQVGYISPVSASQVIENAASARVQGIELDVRYSPRELDGLSLSGSINYGRARYKDYIGPCYTGQTIAGGCNIDTAGNIVSTSGGVSQNFGGRPLLKAPDWTGSINIAYDMPITTNGMSLGLSAGGVYTGAFYPIPEEVPESLQRKSFNIDAQVRLFNDEQGWELALIGKNLTDQRRMQLGVQTLFTPGVPAGTGTNGPIARADLNGFANRPRQFMLRLTKKFGA